MNRVPRAERLPLSSRQSVRLTTGAPQISTDPHGQQESGDEQRHDSHFEFESPVLPPVWKAGSSSKSREIRTGVHLPTSDGEHRAPRTGLRRNTKNKQSWVDFPLTPTSAPLTLIPPTCDPPAPAPEALRTPFKQLAPHVKIERNLEELRRIHPHLLQQISDPILLEVLKDEERLLQEERARLRDAGDFGPEGVEEMRDEPVLPTGATMTAAWDENRKSVLMFLVGDDDSNQIYLHEFERVPHVGIVRSVHARPIFSSSIPILQIGVSARTQDPKALPVLLLFIRTAATTSIWNVQRQREDDVLTVRQMPRNARPEKRKRLGSRRERTKNEHPYALVRISNLPTYADERPNGNATEVPPTGSARSEVFEQDEDDEGVHDGGSEEDETWLPRITSSAKGKGKATQRIVGNPSEAIMDGLERHDDDMDIDQDDAAVHVDSQSSPQPAAAPARKHYPPIVDAAWHPSDPNRLLTVDAIGRLGIWVYDPGIFKQAHRRISEAFDPELRFPLASGSRMMERKAAFFQIQWSSLEHIAFMISRTQLRVINVETGASMTVMDTRTLPQLSSLLSRPQFIRMLPSHIDELNFGSSSNGRLIRTSILAVLTTVEVLFWQTAALEQLLLEDHKHEEAIEEGLEPLEGTPSRRSSRIEARHKFRAPAPEETSLSKRATRKRQGSAATKPLPVPFLRWEHLRGQDRSLNLSWIPFDPNAGYQALVISSARSRVAFSYTIRIEGAAQGGQMRDDEDICMDAKSGSGSHRPPSESLSLFQQIRFRGLAPTLLPTGIPARTGWEIKQLHRPSPFPRSANAPLFIRFDLPSSGNDEKKAASNSRTADDWEDTQDDDSEAEKQDLTATAAPNRRPKDQIVMLEQDSRCAVIGTVCEIQTNVTSQQMRDAEDDDNEDLNDGDNEAAQFIRELAHRSGRGRKPVKRLSRWAARAHDKINVLLSRYHPQTIKNERLRFAPDRVQRYYHEEHQKGLRGIDKRAENVSEGWKKLANLTSNRRSEDKDSQRDRKVADLRGLYKVLMQISTVSQGEDVSAVESMIERAIRGIQAGDLMSSLPQVSQLFLALAHAEDPIASCSLDYASPSLSATLALPITLLLQFPTARTLIGRFVAALNFDCFIIRPFRLHNAITRAQSASAARPAEDQVLDEVDEEVTSDERLSLDSFDYLAARIKQMYFGSRHRDRQEPTGFLGAASDQLAFDLLLSSVAVSSHQIGIVVSAENRTIDSQANDNLTWNNHVAIMHEQDTPRSGIEEVLRTIAKAAGNPEDRLAEPDEESDGEVDEASQAASQSQQGQSQSQRKATGSQSRSQSRSRGGIRSSQASASARSSRVEELEDRIDRHFDALEQKHLPEIEFPFLRPYLRPPEEQTQRTKSSRKKKKRPNSKFVADPEWVPVTTTSRAARLLLSDWVIGEKVDVQGYGDPYALPAFDEMAGERHREARWRRDTSMVSQVPTVGPRTPGRTGGSHLADSSMHSQPIERWRTSTAAAASSRPALIDIPPMTPGLHQSGIFSPRMGFDFGGFGPPQIGARPSLGVLSSPPAALRHATRNDRRTFGKDGGAVGSHSQGQELLRAGGVQSSAAHASASTSSQQANQYDTGAMVGSSQQDVSDAGMVSTQPLPGRFADRRAAPTPSMILKKKAKKKRAGGF